MKARSTFIVLALALALGAYLFFYESEQTLPEEDTHDVGPRLYLFEFPTDEATTISIALAERPTVRLERDGEGWRVESEGGKSYEADPSKVEDFLETLRGIQGTALVEEGDVSLADYGLGEPTGRIWVRGQRKQEGEESAGEAPWEHALLLGGDTPIGSRRYVTKEGERSVLLLESYVVRQLQKGVDDFRPRKLLAFDPAQVVAIEITHHRGGRLRIERSEGNWHLAEPAEGPALDQNKVDEFLENLRLLRVSEFTSEQVGAGQKFGLDKPTRRYRVLGGDDRELAWLGVGNRKGGATGDFYVQVKGRAEAFLVAPYALDRLPQSVEDVRAPEPEKKAPSGESPTEGPAAAQAAPEKPAP